MKSPALARDFRDAVQPLYTIDSGPLNLANFYPLNYACAPDLGPKLYAAMASKQDNGHHGSTRLHKDVSDVVNIMASDGQARWDVFTSEDSGLVKTFVISHFKLFGVRPEDSINAHNVYLTPDDLKELRDKHNVMPFTFYQSWKDVVYIPAGCAYQVRSPPSIWITDSDAFKVSNVTPCIKVAANFLSPQSLVRCLEVDGEFRQCTQATDALEVYNLLVHCWMALNVLEKRLPLKR